MPNSIELLQQLLKIKSYSGEEGPIQAHIEKTFAAGDVEAFRQGDNLIIHLTGNDPTRAFIFNSHVDVVDAGDETRWAHDPWSGERANNRIYGRGASDMKAGVAASMVTATSLAHKETLPTDVWFTYVVREEIDGSGTESFANWFKQQGYVDRYREVAAVFTEPTDLQGAEYGHRGNYFLKATLDGDAGHASTPKNIKTHAIMEMMHFIGDLEEESGEWEERFGGGEFASPTITPTAFDAKSGSPNKVSDHAEASFDMRTIPSFHREAFERVVALAATRGITISLLYPEAPAGYTDPNARIIQALKSVVPDLQLSVAPGSADLGFLTEMGVEGVIFGPGNKAQMHVIDESTPVDQVEKAPQIFEDLYYAWANKEK